MALVPCAQAKRTLAQKKQLAQAQFESAEKMREALNGRPESERTRRDYNRVTEAFRKVYILCANFRKADESIVDTAELLAETGRAFHDPQASRDAIAQYQFLMKEYPGSVHNTAAMFTIGKIYQEDLGENDRAKAAFEEFLQHHPQHRLSDDARQALEEIAHPQSAAKKEKKKSGETASERRANPESTRTRTAGSENKPNPELTGSDAAVADLRNPVIDAESHPDETGRKGKLPLVTGIRHWSTPDYTRVAIDLEDEVKYEAGRIPSPDRVFFDLQSTKLAPELTGKSFEVSDGFLRKIRVAQYQRGVTRVVLEVDPVSEYSAFLLPNPYRLIIDIHGKAQASATTAGSATESKIGSPNEKTPPAEKAPANLKTTSSPSPAGTVSRNNTGTAASPSQSSISGSSPALSAVLPSSAVWTPAPPAKSPQDERKPAEDTNKARENRSSASDSKTATEKSNTKSASAEAARNDPANLLAVGKSNEPELKATNKPTTAPTFEQVTPRTEHVAGSDARATDNAAKHPSGNAASLHSSSTSDASASGGDAEESHTAQTKTAPEVISDLKPGRQGKSKEKDSEIISHEAQPTADGQRSLIRALGLKIGRIVVDAGHGGHDTGTIGPHGLEEKDLVLDVALRLGKLLQKKMGAEVTYTRNDDTFVPLETRTAIANQNQADLFISVHANSSPDPSARGVETYYLNFTSSAEALEVAARENAVSEKSIHELQDLVKKIALKEKIEESREFATDVQSSLSTGLSTRGSRMRNRGVKKAPFIVLIGANMPSILAEISFVSNPGDEKKLQTSEYRQKIAESLYRGIAKYVSGLSGMKMALNRSGD